MTRENPMETPATDNKSAETGAALRKLLRLVARRVVERLKQQQTDQQLAPPVSPGRKIRGGRFKP